MIFWLTPTLLLKALKSVHRLGLEAKVLTLEHIFVNSLDGIMRHFYVTDFWNSPLPAPGTKRCLQDRSVGCPLVNRDCLE